MNPEKILIKSILKKEKLKRLNELKKEGIYSLSVRPRLFYAVLRNYLDLRGERKDFNINEITAYYYRNRYIVLHPKRIGIGPSGLRKAKKEHKSILKQINRIKKERDKAKKLLDLADYNIQFLNKRLTELERVIPS